MKLKQLSVFLENKPGRLSVPCKALADAGLNIVTLSLADTHQFGILRLVLREWEQAKAALEAAGCVVNVTEVVAVEVSDQPGGLAGILEQVEQSEMNVEYMYAFPSGREDTAVLVFRFDEPDAAIEALQAQGFNVVAGVELFDREST